MLNPFPIQFLAMFAYFLLRFFVGSVLIYLGLKHSSKRNELREILVLSWFPYGTFITWAFIITEIVTGSFLILGAHVQYVALVLIAMCLKMFVMRNWFDHPSIPSKLFYVLLFAASVSLFITGAGVFAFDLPI